MHTLTRAHRRARADTGGRARPACLPELHGQFAAGAARASRLEERDRAARSCSPGRRLWGRTSCKISSVMGGGSAGGPRGETPSMRATSAMLPGWSTVVQSAMLPGWSTAVQELGHPPRLLTAVREPPRPAHPPMSPSESAPPSLPLPQRLPLRFHGPAHGVQCVSEVRPGISCTFLFGKKSGVFCGSIF